MALYSGRNYVLFKGRDNTLRLQLLIDKEVVPTNTVLRAVMRVRISDEDVILDTSDIDDDITLTDDNTVIEVGAGALGDTPPGSYHTWLTVYDAVSPDGLAWDDIDLRVVEWKADEE